ncbi:TSY1 [Auxenochlorella protothecoides x Auxenochlorella symbiontica]
MSRVASCFLPARCLPLVRAAWLHNSSIWYRPPIYDWCFRGHRPLTSLRAVGVGAQGLQVRDGGSTPSPGPTDAAAERRSSLLSVLRSRGLLADVAGGAEGLTAAAAAGPLRVYCGFDPTAQSLHLGNLLCLMVLAWFQRCGHQAVALMGGATGRIGDPSGKSSERPVLDEAEVAANAASIARNVEALLQRVPGSTGEAPLVLDNYEWWSGMGLLDFLRDVGRHARVGTMLAKDSVRTRLESETGISFTEFSYQLLQGQDFVHLRKTHGVRVQVGGSDQWGNITAGTELIRKTMDADAFGLTVPLLLKSDGTKFGKSEGGAIWLSPAKLSPYAFYQALLATADDDVARMLRALTFLPLEQIDALLAPGQPPAAAQRALAAEVTRFVHGEDGLRDALAATRALAPGSSEGSVDLQTLEAAVAGGAPKFAVDREAALGGPLIDLLVRVGAQPSKGAARRLVQGRGLRVNNKVVTDEGRGLAADDLVDGRLVMVSLGKKKKLVLELGVAP